VRHYISYTLVCALISLGTVGQAQDRFRPLNEALNQEQSLTMTNYIVKRCAALTMEMAHRTERGEKRDGSDELIDFMKASYEKLASFSITLTNVIKDREGAEAYETANEVLADVLKMQQQYFDEMEDHYKLTGNSLSEQAQQDLNICVEISKSF
jgi:hypothetical protein